MDHLDLAVYLAKEVAALMGTKPNTHPISGDMQVRQFIFSQAKQVKSFTGWVSSIIFQAVERQSWTARNVGQKQPLVVPAKRSLVPERKI